MSLATTDPERYHYRTEFGVYVVEVPGWAELSHAERLAELWDRWEETYAEGADEPGVSERLELIGAAMRDERRSAGAEEAEAAAQPRKKSWLGRAIEAHPTASVWISAALFAAFFSLLLGDAAVAVLGTGLLFVHEYGHVIQLRREGIPASAPLFIPGLGALVMMEEMPESSLAEARVGLAGPVLGTAAAAAAALVGWLAGSDVLLAAAGIGFYINLFNLIPVSPLDGGRALAAVSPWLWLGGIGLLGVVLWHHPSPLLGLVTGIGLLEVVVRLRHRNDDDYFKVTSWRARALVLGVYLGMAALIYIGCELCRPALHAVLGY
jgi:Zn-dependent protease